MEEIERFLYLQNPWWTTRSFSFHEASWFKREIFPELWEYLKLPQMIALVGLRRTGKTTLLRQSIDFLLKKEKVSPISICYFSFEEIGVQKEKQILEGVIETYIKKILQKEIWQIEKIFFFFDEVQYIPYWQSVLKRYYDLNKNIKFVISGSSSLFLREEAKESLAGRMFDIKLSPLSFREFLAIGNYKVDLRRLDIWDFSKRPTKEEILLFPRLEGLFLSYLSWGQFPELLALPDFGKKRIYLKECVIEKILERDLPLTLKIEYPEKLKSLAYVLLEGSGQEIEFKNLGEDLGISRETVRKYTSFLEKGFLIHQILNSSGSFRGKERRSRKIYAASPNFSSVILGESEMGINFQNNLGKIVETFICQELIKRFGKVFFWKERNKEVDFVLGNEKNMYPLEVKFQEKIKREDFKNLLLLMKRRNYQQGFLLTKNRWEEIKIEDKLIFLRPAFLL